MITEELRSNQRIWEQIVDDVGTALNRCLRAQAADWVSDAAQRYRDELGDRARELSALQEQARAVAAAYARHIQAVDGSPIAALPVF